MSFNLFQVTKNNLGLFNLDKFYPIYWLIQLSVIPLSGTYSSFFIISLDQYLFYVESPMPTKKIFFAEKINLKKKSFFFVVVLKELCAKKIELRTNKFSTRKKLLLSFDARKVAEKFSRESSPLINKKAYSLLVRRIMLETFLFSKKNLQYQ